MEPKFVGARHQDMVQLLRDRLASICTNEDVPRIQLLVAPTGCGKSRVVREFYRSLRLVQSEPGYWPELGGAADLELSGGRSDPLPFRKVLGPSTDGFTWEPKSIPSFFWWGLNCDQSQSGAAVRVVNDFEREMKEHVPALVMGVRRAEGKVDSFTRELWTQLRAGAAELVDAGKWDALAALLDAVGIPSMGLGVVVEVTKLGRKAGKEFKERQAAHGEGRTYHSENDVTTLVDSLRRFARSQMPVVIAIEDLHLMGDDLALFLDAVAMFQFDRPVLLVGTAWPEGESKDCYRQWLNKAVAENKAEVHALGGLALDDLGKIVEEIAPGTDIETTKRIVGHWPTPLELQLGLSMEVMKKRLANGPLVLSDKDLSKMPQSLMNLYAARLLELPERIRHALLFAAASLPDEGGSSSSFLRDIVARAAVGNELVSAGRPAPHGAAVRDGADGSDDIAADLMRANDPLCWTINVAGSADKFREPSLLEVLGRALDEHDSDQIERLRESVLGELSALLHDPEGEDRDLDHRDLDGDEKVEACRWYFVLAKATEQPPNHAFLRAVTTLAQQAADAYSQRDAIEFLEPTLSDAVALFSENSPHDLFIYRDLLATAYLSIGRSSQAIALFKQNLADCERALEMDNSDLLEARHGLATAYDSIGQTATALDLFERNAADRERVLGADDPDTLISRSYVARAYNAIGRTSEAIELLERILAEWELVFGVDNPNTLEIRNDLAESYQSMWRFDEATELLERNLTDGERLHGVDSPRNLSFRHNLAAAYHGTGRADDAILLYLRTLAGCERFLGTDHPDTLTTREQPRRSLRGSRARRRSDPTA